MTNLNYYWQKRNEQEQKARDREELSNSIEQGLAKKATDEKIQKLEAELAEKSRKPILNSPSESSRSEAYYRNLLSKPMLEIALLNGDFRGTYEKQQELLGNWMVSQKAFKEVAIKLGAQLGKTPEEIIAEGMATKEKVLDGETEYGNNFIENEKDDWAIYYAPRIKERFLK